MLPISKFAGRIRRSSFKASSRPRKSAGRQVQQTGHVGNRKAQGARQAAREAFRQAAGSREGKQARGSNGKQRTPAARRKDAATRHRALAGCADEAVAFARVRIQIAVANAIKTQRMSCRFSLHRVTTRDDARQRRDRAKRQERARRE